MTSRRSRAVSRNMIFGPPPILQCENSVEYERLLGRLIADLKPTDIIEEAFIHDIAYWTWELWRWRRMKNWLIDAKWFDAFAWAFTLPPNKRLAHIGETDKIDIKKINAPLSEEENKKWKAIAEEAEEVLGEEEHTDEGSDLAAFASSSNAATTRAFLEQSDYVERINKMIITAESRRNAVYREIDRYRASLASRWREKIRNIEAAEFKVIKPERLRANG